MKRTNETAGMLLGALAAGAMLVCCGGSSSNVILGDAGDDAATGAMLARRPARADGVASCGTIGAGCAVASDCCVNACTGGVCGGRESGSRGLSDRRAPA